MAKKEKTKLSIVEDLFKKLKRIYPDKIIIYNDSFILNELQNSKNTGDSDGTTLSVLKDSYKEAFRDLFYNGSLNENKILFVKSMNGIREVIDSCNNDDSLFYDKIWDSHLIEVLQRNNYEIEKHRFEVELERCKDKASFKNIEINDSDMLNDFINNKNSILLKSGDGIPDVIIDQSLIPGLTERNINTIQFITGKEEINTYPDVFYVTFASENPAVNIYSTYHFISMTSNKE